MIRLTSSDKLQINLSAGVTTNQLPLVASYSDTVQATGVYSTAAANGISSGSTAVDLIAAPAAGSVRKIDFLSVRNADTTAKTVIVQVVFTATTREIYRATLAVDSVLFYSDTNGFYACDANGNVLGATGGAGASFTAASQAEQETGTSVTVGVTPGRQQFHQSACKFHCAANQTGTPAIISSYNVSSLTDGGTGTTQINFTTNMSSANYTVVSTSGTNTRTTVPYVFNVAYTGVYTVTIGSTAIDDAYVTAVGYGDL